MASLQSSQATSPVPLAADANVIATARAGRLTRGRVAPSDAAAASPPGAAGLCAVAVVNAATAPVTTGQHATGMTGRHVAVATATTGRCVAAMAEQRGAGATMTAATERRGAGATAAIGQCAVAGIDAATAVTGQCNNAAAAAAG